ncbi:MAG: bifunctional phosphopantothenoylcysteine decarboxylase/phosphopantothenate--cysteine ligase CoaBC [bacterium]
MRILMIVCGGVSAYKALDFVREFKRDVPHLVIDSVLSDSASSFVTPLSLSTLSGGRVYESADFFKKRSTILHIELARDYDRILVFSATLHFMAKIALGLCNDLASSVIMATRVPVCFVPAMNVEMWQQAVCQRHVRQLQEDGYHFVLPEEGEMACGEQGVGRLAAYASIKDKLLSLGDGCRCLLGKKVLLTTGATFEPIDAVRGLTNRSSGKQGLALFQAFKVAGAKVFTVAGRQEVEKSAFSSLQSVTTAEDMHRQVQRLLVQESIDIMICVAAVSDWCIAQPDSHKQKKSKKGLTLEFVPTVDILQSVGCSDKKPPILIGFAAETQQLQTHAQQKLRDKGADLIVANDVSEGQVFGSEYNQVTLYDRENQLGVVHQKMTKKQVASLVVDWVCKRQMS